MTSDLIKLSMISLEYVSHGSHFRVSLAFDLIIKFIDHDLRLNQANNDLLMLHSTWTSFLGSLTFDPILRACYEVVGHDLFQCLLIMTSFQTILTMTSVQSTWLFDLMEHVDPNLSKFVDLDLLSNHSDHDLHPLILVYVDLGLASNAPAVLTVVTSSVSMGRQVYYL